MTFNRKLKDILNKIKGKKVSNLSVPSNFIKVILTNGQEYNGGITDVGSDNFTIRITHVHEPPEVFVVKMSQVVAFSQQDRQY